MHDGQLIVAFGSSIKRIAPTVASNGQSVRFLLEVPPSPFQIFALDTAKLR